jgi:diaminopimelate epimerase
MQRKLVLEFTKMNGAGNDFIVIDNRFYNFTDTELTDLARKLCPRRIGIGADGILAFARPEDKNNHYRMRYLNADGSIGTMCGNGARCLARYAREAGVQDEEMQFETDAGVYRAMVPYEPEAHVRLFVPSPRDWRPSQPLADTLPEAIPAVHYLWTGTEHVVCFLDNVVTAPVQTWGPRIRHDDALAPAGANVNFVQVLEPENEIAHLRARTFEKGVEQETLACGTGAMASALAAHLLGHTHARLVHVHMPGGTLGVGFRRDGADITDLYLEGPVETVYRGTVEI